MIFIDNGDLFLLKIEEQNMALLKFEENITTRTTNYEGNLLAINMKPVIRVFKSGLFRWNR